MSKRLILHGMQILTEGNWLQNNAIIIENKVIHSIIPKEMIKNHLPAHCHEFAAEDYLVPGLIDLHVHGCGGKDVMDGDEEAVYTLSDFLAQQGVTGFLATTMTDSQSAIEKVLECIARLRSDEAASAVLGIHLEGPFLAKAKAGAQALDHLCLPDEKLIRRWQKLSQDAIKLVTLAPELTDAVSFIKTLTSMNIIAAAGHTNASYEEINEAIAAGCSYATHLFNAMSGLHQRAPGAAGALLLSSDVTAELIVDGLHLHPAMVQLAYKMKGGDKLLLVTDAMRAACMGDGCYELGGQEVTVTHGKATLANGKLAGSTLSMLQAVKNMMQFSGCTLAEAIQLASYNPARLLKLSNRKGKIAVGCDADVVVVGADLRVKMTVRAGREVYRR